MALENGMLGPEARYEVNKLQPLIVMPATGPMAGVDGVTFISVGQVVVPGGTIRGGEFLTMSAMLSKLSTPTTGWAWQIKIGSVVIFQNSINASVRFANIFDRMFISTDRKWGYSTIRNAMGETQLDTADVLTGALASNSARVNISGRQRSTSVPFVSYSTSPTVETVLVDFDEDQILSVDLIGGSDVVEVTGFALEIARPARFSYSTKRQIVFGDSITESTGATSDATGFVNKLRLLRKGTPIVSSGLGGQKSPTIVDRLVADKSAQQSRVVLAMGTNDFDDFAGGDGTGWFNAVKTQVDRAVAYMGHSDWLWVSPTTRGNWTVNDTNDTALQYVIAQMIATYGTAHVLNMRAELNNTTDLVDTVHPNDTGHNKMAVALDAKETAIGWAA